jgi:hypothetical protein
MQFVAIITKVFELNFCVSSSNEIDHYNLTEVLLKLEVFSHNLILINSIFEQYQSGTKKQYIDAGQYKG